MREDSLLPTEQLNARWLSNFETFEAFNVEAVASLAPGWELRMQAAEQF